MRNILLLAAAILLACCRGEISQNTVIALNEPDLKPAQIALRKHFACLPKEAAIVAAHRGTSKKRIYPRTRPCL